MEYLSFGKIAVKKDQIDAFIHEAKSKGLHVKCIKDNIYEFGIQLPSLMDPESLRQTAGLIGLKYSAQ